VAVLILSPIQVNTWVGLFLFLETKGITMTETLNNTGTSSSPEGGELVETIGVSHPVANTEPEGAKNTEAESAKELEAGGTETAETDEGVTDPPKPKGEEFRFDKHPRFIELNTRLKQAEETNRKILEELALAKSKADVKQEQAFRDWTQMKDEELLEWQTSDPKGYLENLKAFTQHAIQSGINEFKEQFQKQVEQQTYEQKIQSTYEAYAKENPDFDEMWDSGELKDFMDKHPGHNAISAHIMLTAEKRQQEAIEKAVAEALKKKEAEIKSKRAAAKVISAGPAVVPTPASESDDRLKNPTQYGGKANVLVQRLLERRKAMGG